jgi:tRNA(fMet)-specific endonuclease VapC
LYYGAYKSRHVNENLERITEFVVRNVVLGCDAQTARSYGVLKDDLRRKGRPLPENDVWIAALAKQHGLVLVSRDRHFAEVTDVQVEVW